MRWWWLLGWRWGCGLVVFRDRSDVAGERVGACGLGLQGLGLLAGALGEGVGGLALQAACWWGSRGHHGLSEGIRAAGWLGLHWLRRRLLLYRWFLDLWWRLHLHWVSVCGGGILSKWVASRECVLWLLRLWAIATKTCPCKLGL